MLVQLCSCPMAATHSQLYFSAMGEKMRMLLTIVVKKHNTFSAKKENIIYESFDGDIGILK
jgi:hypothetical protein